RFFTAVFQLVCSHGRLAQPHVSHRYVTAVHQEVVGGGTDHITVFSSGQHDPHRQHVPLGRQLQKFDGHGAQLAIGQVLTGKIGDFEGKLPNGTALGHQ